MKWQKCDKNINMHSKWSIMIKKFQGCVVGSEIHNGEFCQKKLSICLKIGTREIEV